MRNILILLMALPCFVAGSGGAVAGEDDVSRAEAKEWLEGYKSAWENRDADKAAALFTRNATYQDNPYETPYRGQEGIRKYWSDVTRNQRDVKFRSELLTTYEHTAVAHWSAEFINAESGATIRLNGIFLLEFDDGGLCKSLREWWHLKVEED